MKSQILILPNPSASQKEKGDFFGMLLRLIMETQRYRVLQQINFTGTEIDLLCEHLDRPRESALVECKARSAVNSADVKNFAFDIVVSKRAEYGYFVHTSELQHQALGLVTELKSGENARQLIFWGPDKVIDLLQHLGLIKAPPNLEKVHDLTPTKQLLLYTYLGRFWVTLLSNKMEPTHYHVEDALSSGKPISAEANMMISQIEELRHM